MIQFWRMNEQWNIEGKFPWNVILHSIYVHCSMDCARQLCCYICFFFVFSVHIAHLRQGINLSSENEKSASQGGLFFFPALFYNSKWFSLLYSYAKSTRVSEWMCLCVWIEHFLVLFSEKCMLCGLIEFKIPCWLCC